MSIAGNFITATITRMKYYKELSEKAIAQLQDEELYKQPTTESNSVAVIVRHMAGNMLSRWTNFLEEDGEKSWRQREDEFKEGKYSREQLMESWNKAWSVFLDALASLEKKDLKKTVHIRQEELGVTDAIVRQIAHYTYHTGQIIYVARLFRGKDWKNLSIPKGESNAYNEQPGMKDPAKKFTV